MVEFTNERRRNLIELCAANAVINIIWARLDGSVRQEQYSAGNESVHPGTAALFVCLHITLAHCLSDVTSHSVEIYHFEMSRPRKRIETNF